MTYPKSSNYLAVLAAVGTLATASVAGAATTVYSNVSAFTGGNVENGAATAVDTPSVDFTPLIADDITPVAGFAGAPVTSINFNLINVSGSAVSVNPDLRFYAADGANGGPGTLLAIVNVVPITQTSGTIQVYTVPSSSAAGFFALPATTFWAGIAFSDGGTATATAAQLAGFGQGTFDPPTVGSSQNVAFQSTTTTDFTTSNPTGGLFNFTGGTPLADFGWGFSVTPVPEPASVGLLAAAGGLLLSRRRRTA